MSTKFYLIAEIAAILRVSPSTVRSLIARRELTAVRVGHQFRISAEALQEYLNNNS